MEVKSTAMTWAVCLLTFAAPAHARGSTDVLPPDSGCLVAPVPALTVTAGQDFAVAKTGRIPRLGTVQASIGWDNRKSVSLVSDEFVVRRTLNPLTQRVEITISGAADSAAEDVPLYIRVGGAEGLRVMRGNRTVDAADTGSIQAALEGRAIASFRELIGNYERSLISARAAAREDDPHADGFLLVGAFLSSLAGDPTAVARARDLIVQRIYGKLRAARFDFRDCVTEYELYLMKIDTQRTLCLDAANSRDSWYARAGDRLACEAEYIAQALAGEGQFASCTMLGTVIG